MIIFVRSLARKRVTSRRSPIKLRVVRLSYDDSRFMSTEKENDQREREEMMVLMTTKYSRDPFVATKSEPEARSSVERGAR